MFYLRREARSHAEGRALKLVGYYQATDRITEAVLQPVGERVASSVREGFADAVAIVVRVCWLVAP